LDFNDTKHDRPFSDLLPVINLKQAPLQPTPSQIIQLQIVQALKNGLSMLVERSNYIVFLT